MEEGRRGGEEEKRRGEDGDEEETRRGGERMGDDGETRGDEEERRGGGRGSIWWKGRREVVRKWPRCHHGELFVTPPSLVMVHWCESMTLIATTSEHQCYLSFKQEESREEADKEERDVQSLFG